MNNKKMSAEEIATLQKSAQDKREQHRKIIKEIGIFAKNVINCYSLLDNQNDLMPPSRQLEIIKRGYQEEIMLLLKAFKDFELAQEAQMYIYEHRTDYAYAYAYMIKNMKLCFELEKELFANAFYCKIRQYSHQAQLYIVQKVVEEAGKIPPKYTFLNLFKDYSKIYQLCNEAEVLMVKSFLTMQTGRDSMIDELQRRVRKYLEYHKIFSDEAQLALVETGHHEMIMTYIRNSSRGLSCSKAVDKLIERADREELEAYYERYVTL